jgi:hypothetical protein
LLMTRVPARWPRRTSKRRSPIISCSIGSHAQAAV